jgi:hypothetical protein
MDGDGRINEVTPERPQPRESAIFVGAGKPAVANHVGRQNSSELSALWHESTLEPNQSSTTAHSKSRDRSCYRMSLSGT